MRAIKFRAWDKGNKQMCYNIGTLGWDSTGRIDLFEGQRGTGGAAVLWDSEFVIMQFTGLLDKNGKEIYEGDVVKARTNYFPRVNLGGVVVFEDAEYLIEQNDGHFPLCSFHVVDRLTIEVIGNIHENPELLEDMS